MTPDILSSLNKSGSGLNLRELSRTLASAETAPQITRLQRGQDADNLRLSGLAQVRAQLDALGGALVRAAGNPVLSVETDTPALVPRVTDRAALTSGSMLIDVANLARPQVLEFGGFTDRMQSLAAGEITLDFGTWDGDDFTANAARAPISLTIEAGTTLQALAETLNRMPGVTAQILDKGDGTFSLGLLSETGAQNALRLTALDSGGGGGASLTVLDTTGTNTARQVQAADDARIWVNGISLSRASNTLTDVLPGVEISLLAATSGTLKVDRSEAAARTNVQTLVDGLNETLSLLRNLTRSGASGDGAGELAGDRNLQALEAGLRRLISEPLRGFSERPISLADLGIATERNGSLRFDPPAFDRSFASRAGDFDALFANKLQALSGRATVAGTPAQTLAGGDYAFRVDAAGIATLDGFRMSSFTMADGQMRHTALDGPLRGVSVTGPADLNSDTIQFGRSFAESLAILLDRAVSSTGLVGRRETEIDRQNSQRSQRIEMLETRAALIEKRYLSRFAAMEQAVSQMNSTSSYLSNLVDMWSRPQR
ncbi:MAG: flagellar filament capping protein FliD [Roseinatronobacter sp.]|nr:flagellar filament capping protein FliD [Roseinatronobacter sp.]